MNLAFGFKRDELSAGNQLGLAAPLPDGAISVANHFAVIELWFQFIAPNIFCCLSVYASDPLLCCVTTECQCIKNPESAVPTLQGQFPLPHVGMQCQTR